MTNKDAYCIESSKTLAEAMTRIDGLGTGLVVAIGQDGGLQGVVTDGDIRRAFLAGVALQSPIAAAMNREPFFLVEPFTKAFALNKMKLADYSHVPVVNEQHIVQYILSRSELEKGGLLCNPVILMVGGLGTRLEGLTQNCPKPMLPIGGKPILLTIMERFIQDGFINFFLAVNYKSEIIEDFFKDGGHLGISVTYLRESKRLGTAGALALMTEKPGLPSIVMNGDILTNFSPRVLLETHIGLDVAASMAVREFTMQVPYGVIVKNEENHIVDIEEKPTHTFSISAGIYVLSPVAFDFVPRDTFFDMPELFKVMIRSGAKTACVPFCDYWKDIGRISDYHNADKEYDNFFS